MTYQEVYQFVDGLGYDCAYYQFDETGQQPPFICWYFPDINDVYADNINYQRIVRLVIEFYTNEKDFNGEQTIEAALTQGGFSYSKTETYIDSERMHETVYEMEVLINGEQS